MAANNQNDAALQMQAIVSALETIMNPMASQEQRAEAHKLCENFKETSKCSVEYGLQLANKENSPVVRHFGLQTVEHFIKFRWNETQADSREELKKSALNLISSGTKDMMQEEIHIKDGVSRILVELMKREWPQMWDSLFTHFTQLCDMGETQTELVLKILLRLAEDIIQFQNIPTGRRRDIQQALTAAMASVFSFFLFTFKKHLEEYRLRSGADKLRACSICQSCLDTLAAYVDWVNISYIMESQLLPLLCMNLLDKELCLKASECLLVIVGRKGSLDERKPLMVLFEQEPMNVLLEAANNATEHISESTNYLFLKRLCEIMLEIGKQLCSLWGNTKLLNNDQQGRPANFETYLKALVAFTQHPSQTIRHMTYSIWLAFLRHPFVSKDPVFLAVIPTLIQCGRECLHKVGFPGQNNSPSCAYSRMDFDTDEEFSVVLSTLRMSVLESIRSITLMNPKMTFFAASNWLKELLRSPITVDLEPGSEKAVCNLASPSFISWDACSFFLEGVMSRLFMSTVPLPSTQEGIDLLNMVLEFDTQDPLILSAVLSCVSGLFPFLTSAPQSLPKVLTKIFGAVVFNLPGQTKSSRSQAVKNVRTHACSILVKVCKNHPDLLLPEFDTLYSSIKQLDSDKEQLSQMEKIILIEALIIVSNCFHNYERQSAFLEEILGSVKELWASQEFATAFRSPENFMSYVGLNQAAVEPSSADTCGINRSHITYCINTILAVIKRSQWPGEFSVAERGGFVVHLKDGSNYLRNPATHHVCPLFDNLIILIRTSCDLFKPEYLQLRHVDFLKAYDLMEHDKNSILGIPPVCVDNSDTLVHRQPLERMQNFLNILFEQGFHILGNSSQYLGVEFYNTPGLARIIVENLIESNKQLPDHRARLLTKNFLKTFMAFCPKDLYSSVAIPVLSALCPQMYQRLMERWKVINERAESGQDNDATDAESEEILAELLVRNMTKDYLELLNFVLFRKGPSSEVKEETDMDESGDFQKQTLNSNKKELSDLGIMVLAEENLYPSIIMCVLTAFSWSDTAICHKCGAMCWPICKQLLSQGKMSGEAAQHTFMSILSGLQLHGQHDNCQSSLLNLAFNCYEEMWREYPVLKEILVRIPDVDMKVLQDFHTKLSHQPKAGVSEKKMKDLFKKILSGIIGKNIGQKFRRTAQYANLPRLFLESRKPKQPSLDEMGENLGLIDLFMPSDVFE